MIINQSNSTVIEFELNRKFAPLIPFDFVWSSVYILVIFIFSAKFSVLLWLIGIFYGLAFLHYFNSHRFLKKIIIKRDYIEFKYYFLSVQQEFIHSPQEVKFIVKVLNDKLKVKILNHSFILNDAHDLFLVTEHISTLLNLEFVETTTLSKNEEVLIYHRK